MEIEEIKKGKWYFYKTYSSMDDLEPVKCIGIFKDFTGREEKVLIHRKGYGEYAVSPNRILTETENPSFFGRLFEKIVNKFFGDEDEEISINTENN